MIRIAGRHRNKVIVADSFVGAIVPLAMPMAAVYEPQYSDRESEKTGWLRTSSAFTRATKTLPTKKMKTATTILFFIMSP